MTLVKEKRIIESGFKNLVKYKELCDLNFYEFNSKNIKKRKRKKRRIKK